MSRVTRQSNQEGFILIATMIFLQIFVLFTVNIIFSVLQVQCKNQHMLARHVNLTTSLHILIFLENNLSQLKQACTVPVTSPVTLKSNPEQWWRANTCSGITEDTNYYYFIESLGADACGFLTTQNSKQKVADFYRLTLYFSKKNANESILLQTTTALPISPVNSCQTRPHQVKLGRQMWREI